MIPDPKPKPLRVMSSVTVSYPPRGAKTHCDFSIKCRRELLDRRLRAVSIISVNGTGTHIEWACIACARTVILKHMERLSRFQGFLIDALNRANEADYFKSRLTATSMGLTPSKVMVYVPPDKPKPLKGDMVEDETE